MIVPPEVVAMLEDAYTNQIAVALKKYAWADKLEDSKGQRKFAIYFQPGDKFEFRCEVHTTIKLIIRGTSVYGGPVLITDLSIIDKTINLLEKIHKFLRSSELDEDRFLFESTGGKVKKHLFNYEPDSKLKVIPKRECKLIKYTYKVECVFLDTETRDQIKVSGENISDELLQFSARNKFAIMREEDEARGC
jgi:hypothetical protein